MHIIDMIRGYLANIPQELAQHPTVARGIGEFVQGQINRELNASGLPYQVDVQFVAPAPIPAATI